METEKYIFKRLTEEMLPDLLPLFESAYGKAPTLKELSFKYKTKVFGLEFCGYVCYFESEAVAFVGAVPCFLTKGEEQVFSAQIGDVMTDPKHIRYGLFHQTAKRLFDFLQESKVEVIFGFPNLNSKPGFKKRLGWEFTDDLKVSIIDSKCLPFLRLSSMLPFFKKVLLSYQKVLISLVSTSPKPFKSSLGDEFYEVRKDFNYINYKLAHKQSFFIKVKSKIVWIKFDKMFLYVGNIESCSYDEFLKIVKKLKSLCFYMGIPHLRFNVSGGAQIKKYLDKYVSEDPKNFAVGGLIFKEGLSFENLKFIMSDNDTF